MNEKDIVSNITRIYGEDSPARKLFYEALNEYGVPTNGQIPVPTFKKSEFNGGVQMVLLDPEKAGFTGAIQLEQHYLHVVFRLFAYPPEREDIFSLDDAFLFSLESGAFSAGSHGDQWIENRITLTSKPFRSHILLKEVQPVFSKLLLQSAFLIEPFEPFRCSFDIYDKARKFVL